MAGDDLAKALGGVQAGEHAIVQQQAHDINAKLDELRARQSDPALIEVRAQVPRNAVGHRHAGELAEGAPPM